MKRTFTKLAAISMAFMAIASCTKSDDPIVDETAEINLSTYELKFTSPNDSTIDVSVESATDWVALKEGDSGADWITITPLEGKGGIEATKMSVRVSQNESSSERYAMIRVSSKTGNVTKELNVIQFPALSALGRDSLILANFYEATEGWKWKQPWVLEDPVSMWPGVTVAIAGGELRVTRLDFQDQAIKGKIPDDFQYLNELVFLQSYANDHQGQKLPEWLPKLIKLKEFCVASCNMNGPIPESYWDMTQLVQLRLENNGFTGPLSDKISQLVNLDAINLASNPIKGNIPGAIGKMPKLRDVNMNGCSLEGTLPAGIGESKSIQNIRFDGNEKLTGEVPEEWGGLEKLRTLNLAGCVEITKLPNSLSKCAEFWELDIQECAKITEIPETWKDAIGFEYLRAYMSGLTKLPNWETHPSMIAVAAAKSKLAGPIPGFVGGLKNLYLSENVGLTGEMPESFYNTKTLQDADIDGCPLITGTVPTSFWLNQHIVNINFSGTQLGGVLPTDDQYRDLALGIQYINIENCNFEGPLPGELFIMSKLQTARMKGNNFTGTVPSIIAQNTQLSTLSLSDNRLWGEFPATLKGHEGWGSKNMWNPRVNICPQQEGQEADGQKWGFTDDSCTSNIPE